jgi:transcriptional regulator with XRE-family HTH domain
MRVKPLQQRLGSVVRAHREALGHSQESFAETIDLHRNYYGLIERGERNVSLLNLEKIAAGLNMTLSALIQEAERESN